MLVAGAGAVWLLPARALFSVVVVVLGFEQDDDDTPSLHQWWVVVVVELVDGGGGVAEARDGHRPAVNPERRFCACVAFADLRLSLASNLSMRR